MTATPDTTIREIVAADYRTAAVFQRHGLDFCCNGCRTIEQGCRDAGADADALLREIDAVLQRTGRRPRRASPLGRAPRSSATSSTTITPTCARRCRRCCSTPQKIAACTASGIPSCHVARLFERVAREMTDHMAKEEQRALSLHRRSSPTPRSAARPRRGAVRPGRKPDPDDGDGARFVGDAMAEIRDLTDGYTPPDDACATYRVCFQELEAFERDLHAHVHLENNVLFPKASALEGGRLS